MGSPAVSPLKKWRIPGKLSRNSGNSHSHPVFWQGEGDNLFGWTLLKIQESPLDSIRCSTRILYSDLRGYVPLPGKSEFHLNQMEPAKISWLFPKNWSKNWILIIKVLHIYWLLQACQGKIIGRIVKYRDTPIFFGGVSVNSKHYPEFLQNCAFWNCLLIRKGVYLKWFLEGN